MCSENFSFGSSVTPGILEFLTVGMRVLLILRFSVLLYFAGSGVKRVAVDLSRFGMMFHFHLSRSKFLLGRVVEHLELLGSYGEMRQGSVVCICCVCCILSRFRKV